MGDGSRIGWTQATWNPLVGCEHVSPGCDNCYAARQTSGRLKHLPVYSGLAEAGRFTGEVRLLPDRLDQPLRWRQPRLVFVNSMSDLFHRDVPPGFVAKVFTRMLLTPRHTYQVLTKRPQLMAQVLADPKFEDEVAYLADDLLFEPRRGVDPLQLLTAEERCGEGGPLFQNVWLGTSIESDRYAFRADHVRRTPAAVSWLSLEPLLGPVPSLDLARIGWVVVGGESGPGHRPMELAWLEDIVERCDAAGVPVFVKQDSHARSEQQGRIPDELWARKEYPEVTRA